MKTLCTPPAAAHRVAAPTITRPSVGRAIQAYLAKAPLGADIRELEDIFSSADNPALRTLRNLRARLNNMVCLGQLATTGAGWARRWHAIEADAAAAPVAAAAPAATTPANTTAPTMALPNTYDVMNAPVYVPSTMGSGRPGADDFRAIQTRGHPC